MPPARAHECSPVLAGAGVCPGEGLCGAYRDLLVAHGKEKVYGSIP